LRRKPRVWLFPGGKNHSDCIPGIRNSRFIPTCTAWFPPVA
jgi:hypothetical protein